MPQLEHIETIEKRLWSSADNLRANSNYASNEYFLPAMGLIFLRHAYSRYLAVKDAIEASLPKRAGKTRPLTKEDFSTKGALFLRPEAQFAYLVNLPEAPIVRRRSSMQWNPSRRTMKPCRAYCPKVSIRKWITTCWDSFCAPSTTRH